MFENTNRALPVEMAKETMKVHRMRNVMACLAIVLTTILITVVCGVGIGTIDAIMTESGRGINGLGIYGGIDIMNKIREQQGVEWADLARPCMQGTPRNKEFSGKVVRFFGVDTEYYEHHNVKLLSGVYPQNENELILSDALAKKIGKEIVPGQTITLNLIVREDNHQREKPMEFTICGVFDSLWEPSENYEEMYTVETFSEHFNPELGDDASIVYVKLRELTKFSSSDEVQSKLNDLNEAVGGNGIIMDMQADMEDEIAGAVALLLLVMVCGFLLIHNIFRISVVNDIRFIGNMKIIGMTKKQIRVLFGWQVRRLAIIGILAGSVLGEAFNYWVFHFYQSMDMSYVKYFKISQSLIVAVAAGIVFSAVTVWISGRTAISLAKKVSPVAASRYRMSGKRKKVFAVFSFVLGGILFCTLVTVFAGYDADWMVDRNNETDVTIRQWHSIQPIQEPYYPMKEEFVRQICKLDFVKNSYPFYRARSGRCDEADENGYYLSSLGEVKFEGHYRDVMKREFDKMGYIKEDWEVFVQEGRANTGIVGMDAAALDMEGNHVEVLDGKLDAALFATGNYLIYQPFAIPEHVDGKEYLKYGMKAGDTLSLSFWNSDIQEYRTKEFTVMAVVTRKEESYAGEIDSDVQFTIDNETFRDIYGESAGRMLSAVRMNTLGKNPKKEHQTLERLMEEEFNVQVEMNSRYKTRQDEQSRKDQQLYIGVLFGCIVAVIGLANIVNTIATDVLSRKLEFATLQSIGMTKRQMAGRICLDGIRMVLISFVPICVCSLPAARFLAELMYIKYVPSVYAVSWGVILLLGVLAVCITGIALTSSLNRKTIVERLREAE